MAKNMVRLGEVASYINGYAFKPEDRGNVGLPIIRIQDLTGNSYELGYYSGNYPKKIEINDGDILISWSASLGVYVWDKGKALLNQHIFKVEFMEDSIDKRYFVYAVRKKIDEMIRKSHGATMKHIVKKDFEDTLIPYPNLEVQSKIAGELDGISKIIYMRKQQLKLYDNLVRARFVEMFGDPIRNTQNRSTVDVVDVVKMQRGFDLPVQERNYMGKIPVYGSNGVLGYHDIPKVKGEGIITGRSGTIGKVLYTESDYWPLNTTLFSADTYGNDVIYLSYLMEMYDLSRFIEGTGVPTLNRNKFHNKKIINVSINEQTQFSAFVKEVNKSKLLAASQPQIHIYKTLTLL